jgi:putative protein-disulfide isomerase
MPASPATLYYVHDPMCSWCWGIVPVWRQVQSQLPDKINVRYVLGGLAPDSDDPMPESMQTSIRDNWRRIQQTIPGIEFNYDFWTTCQPRRSTYPACRAIIACGMQQSELKEQMLLAIQQAYYLQAKNTSDAEVLIRLAGDIGLNAKAFATDVNSEACNEQLEKELQVTRELGVSSFPSLVLQQGDTLLDIPVDYTESKNILCSVERALDGET